MSSERRYIAFDLGAESGRTIAATLQDGRISLDVLNRFPNGPVNVLGTLYWDILGLFRGLKDGLHAYSAKHGADAASLGVDTWGVDFGLLDERGRLLGNPVCYRDPRTEGVMDKAFKRVSRKNIYQATGIQFLQFNSLYQLYSMVQNEDPLLERAETLLCIADLLHYFFTGEKVQEFSNATTTQMYNPTESEWAVDMLASLDIPTGMLADVVPPGSVVGTVLDAVAGECGINPLPVVAPACHDTGSAVAAVPASGDGWMYLSSGTWSLLGVEIPEPIINSAALDENFTNEGGVDGTYRFLKNIMGLWLVQECRRDFEKAGKAYDYAALVKLAEAASPFTALIDPNDAPFLYPGDMPEKIRAYCRKTGQPVPADEGTLIRVCLESLALEYRRVADAIESLTGRTYGVLHIIGGGCQNDLLNQFTANATGKLVKTGPVEATAFGNVLMQAIGLGDIGSLAEARAIVRASADMGTVEPGPDREKWVEAYGAYLRLRESS